MAEEQKEEQLNKNLRKKSEYVLAIMILGLIILGMFFLTRNAQLSQNKQQADANNNTDATSLELLPLSNTSSVKTDKRTYTIGGQWYVTTLQRGGDSELNCDITAKNCLIYRITNDTYSFYLSTLSVVKMNNPIETSEEKMSIPVLNTKGDFTFEKITLNTRSNDDPNATESTSDQKFYKQGYAKIDDNLYASTGLLNLDDIKVNQAQVSAFKDMLANVK